MSGYTVTNCVIIMMRRVHEGHVPKSDFPRFPDEVLEETGETEGFGMTSFVEEFEAFEAFEYEFEYEASSSRA